MPAVKLSRYAQPKRDPLKGFLLERLNAMHKTQASLAETMGMHPKTFSGKMNSSLDSLSLAQLKTALKFCGADSVCLCLVSGIGEDGKPYEERIRL